MCAESSAGARNPLAIWNPARDVWETESIDLLSEHSDVFSATWPTSGMTRNGVAYELPMPVPRMDASESSSSPTRVFSTPDTMPEAPNKGTNANRTMGLGNQVQELSLLRTAVADEAGGGPLHPDTAKERGQTLRLTGQILAHTGHLLPTPVAQPSGNTPEDHLRKKPGRAQVTDLAIMAENDLFESGGKLLPTPNASDGMMGTPSTSGRPVEKSTFLSTQAMLLAGHLEHRRTGDPMNPRSEGGKS